MRSTITVKILVALTIVFHIPARHIDVFSILTAKTTGNSVLSEQLHDKASNYFDSLNMMMLTGTMAQKETLRQKQYCKAQEGIENITSTTYWCGPVNSTAQVTKIRNTVDDIDKRALATVETIIEPFSAEWGKGLVIATDEVSENYRGTNCVACRIWLLKVKYLAQYVLNTTNLNHVNSLINTQTMAAIGIMAVISLRWFCTDYGLNS